MLSLNKEILHETTKNASLSLTEFREKFGEDLLNELAITSELDGQEIFMLRAYCAYIFQNKFCEQDYIKAILLRRLDITKLFVRLFHSFFMHDEVENSNEIERQICNHLSEIDDEAKILETLLELIKATQRTNFYQKDSKGHFKDYISLKIDLKSVRNVPRPVPYMTSFVYAKNMEGCILRGGKISRGGIRFSHRKDFFTEILALMRAQKLKNTIIIPDGAKGGFIVKNSRIDQTKEERKEASIEAYKILLKGVFDITDNYVEGSIVKPVDVVCKDGDDAYFVVAADRGTGDFSDIANDIAKKYNFWLKDAFASGGSIGYSHKELGVTSRSTWVAVEEHFNSININPDEKVFSTVAIGSMSGDVCGNGLLLSKNIKLVAAFSSNWIFIDPNPNVAVSFMERKRLFETPGANWIDYDKQLISKGGGVFPRDINMIELSEEMQTLFNLEVDEISTENLIKNILTLDVDLLWSGAVGTYIKASSETHKQAMDDDNDMLRVDAEDLRCKTVAEGANLTFTQAGRVEYALKSGLVNTDFIDNSGGVDCSDHEVNFKIALNKAVLVNKITQDERDSLLKEMQTDVITDIIANSRDQNYSLSLSAEESIKHLDKYLKLIPVLEKKVSLDCKFEHLPDIQELERRKRLKLGLLRPELSILLSYSKRAAYEDLITMDKDFIHKFCESLLLEYFPEKIQGKFKDEILSHPLKKEICVTKLANNIIDHTGLYFFHLMQSLDKNITPVNIAISYLIVWKNSGIGYLWNETMHKSNYRNRVEAFFALRKKLCDQIEQML